MKISASILAINNSDITIIINDVKNPIMKKIEKDNKKKHLINQPTRYWEAR